MSNPEKQAIADALFQEITKNKLDSNRLAQLKEEAKEQLNVKFKS